MREKNQKELDYINHLFAPEDPPLQAIRQSLAEDAKEGINIAPYEGKLLQVFLGLIKAQKVVEVGTLYGYSTLWIARALPPEGQVVSLESSQDNYHKAKALLQGTEVWPRIDLHLGDAAKTLKDLNSQAPFDAIFIDANKSSYAQYLDWAEEYIRPGGLIFGDNTFLFGHVITRQPGGSINQKQIDVMQSFNQRLANPTKYRSVLIPTPQGLTVAQKL